MKTIRGKTPYTVQRIRKDDTLYGAIHGSINGDLTVCGKVLTHNWCITNNTFDGMVSCRQCIKILEDTRFSAINNEQDKTKHPKK